MQWQIKSQRRVLKLLNDIGYGYHNYDISYASTREAF